MVLCFTSSSPLSHAHIHTHILGGGYAFLSTTWLRMLCCLDLAPFLDHPPPCACAVHLVVRHRGRSRCLSPALLSLLPRWDLTHPGQVCGGSWGTPASLWLGGQTPRQSSSKAVHLSGYLAVCSVMGLLERERHSHSPASFPRAPLVAHTVKDLPAMRETQVRSLGQEDPLEKGMATLSSILAWRIPRTEEPSRLHSIGLQRVRHD